MINLRTQALLPLVEHAIAAVAPGARDRRERAVALDDLDLQEDVTTVAQHVDSPGVDQLSSIVTRDHDDAADGEIDAYE